MTEINLNGVVGLDFTADDIRSQLPEDGSDVRLNVNSPGGFVFDGIDIFNTLKRYKGKVTAAVTGLAASAASYIIMAADKIGIYDNSVIMIHRSWGLSIGNADELKKEAEFLDGIDNIMAKEYSKRMKKDVKDVLGEMSEEKWMIGADQIISANFADEIFDDAEPEKIEKSEAVALFEAAKNRVEASKSLKEKAAAYIKTEKAPVLREENITQEGNIVNLTEFLEKNPEARAEVDSSVNARAEEAVKADRDRVSEILALSGVKINENILSAITDGTTAEGYAVKELKAYREANAKVEAQNLGTFKTPEVQPEAPPKASEKPGAFDAAVDSFIAKKKGGK